MAVAPLFVATMPILTARLRLNGISASKTGALAQIDQAVEDVRVNMYDDNQGLGLVTVNALLAIAYVENATTASDLSRTRANNLEVTWVRLLLMRRMPTLFMDASGETLDAWNEEPLTHNTGKTLRDEIKRLEDEIAQGVAQLIGDDEDIGDMDVIVFEPAETPARPGASILPGYLSGD